MNSSSQQRGLIVSIILAVLLIVLWSLPAFAQCPLCKMAIENSTQGKAMGRGLNTAILVLLVPPVTVFCSIFVLALKHRRAADEPKLED